MNILIYTNQLLQEGTTGAYFCDISNPTKTWFPHMAQVEDQTVMSM